MGILIIEQYKAVQGSSPRDRNLTMQIFSINGIINIWLLLAADCRNGTFICRHVYRHIYV